MAHAHEAHELRELAEGESGVPGRAWIEYGHGQQVACTLHRTGPRSWNAVPSEAVQLDWGSHLCVDRLGPGCTVSFQDVAPPAEPLGQA